MSKAVTNLAHQLSQRQKREEEKERRNISFLSWGESEHPLYFLRAMKETETSSLTPEQLLQSLDLQIAMSRARRSGSEGKRVIILVAGLLLILIGAATALLILTYRLEDMPRPARDESGAVAH